MKHIEQEFKWQVKHRAEFTLFVQALKVLFVQMSGPQQICQTDYYLDTSRGELSKNKIALRIRRIGRHYEATLKGRSPLRQGLAQRSEQTLELSSAYSVQTALKQLTAKRNWNGICLDGLQVRFRIQNNRTLYTVQYQHCVCEAALDDYLTLAQGHQLRRREIELELKKGSVSDFKKLINKITLSSGLATAEISKVAGAEKWINHKFSLN